MARLIVSLDKLSPEEARKIIVNISESLPEYKNDILYKFNDMIALLGLQWIYELTKDLDIKLMLDPKWHDIPQTLSNYMQKLSDSWLWDKTEYVTIHASNGHSWIAAAVKTRNELGLKTKILAITALTSLSHTDIQSIYDEDADSSTLKLAKIAFDSGADGVVSSAHEITALRSVFWEDFAIVNPGIRFADGDHHEQKRVSTPSDAVERGSTDIVMWRWILQADDMIAAIQRFFDETSTVVYKKSTGHQFEKLLYTWNWKELLSYIGAFYFRPEWWKYCRLTSKLISNAYINIGSVERNPFVIERATSEMAEKLQAQNITPDVVMWAQMWSVRISLYLAEKLWVQESVYTEKTNNNNNEMKLKRHDISLQWKKIVISEDVVNRGSTLRYMVDIVNSLWWEVVWIACLANRHGKDNFDGIPLISCYEPEAFELYWDKETPEEQRKNHSKIPEWSDISPKAKNEWDILVESMKK